MKEELINSFRKELVTLYQDLIDSVKDYKNQSLRYYAAQWGEYFPSEDNDGILFIGRATNDWHTDSEDVGILFGDPYKKDTIFNCSDQMIWVENCAKQERSDMYNSNRSAFWRLIRRIARSHHKIDDIDRFGDLRKIAWSNICKVAPYSGNPNDSLYYTQLDIAEKILETEIKYLSPEYLIFLTGWAWAADTITYLTNLSKEDIESRIEWLKWGHNNKYRTGRLEMGNKVFIISEHPQGKNSDAHFDTIMTLMEK